MSRPFKTVENMKPNRTNKLGQKYIAFITEKNRYVACFKVPGTKKHKDFETLDEAIQWRDMMYSDYENKNSASLGVMRCITQFLCNETISINDPDKYALCRGTTY